MTFAVFPQNENTRLTRRSKVSGNGVHQKGNALQDVTNRASTVLQPTKETLGKSTYLPKSSHLTGTIPSAITTHKIKVLNPFESQSVVPVVVPQNPFDVLDIDKDDHSDPLAATDYVYTIYDYLRQKEKQSTALPDLADKQSHIDTNMLSTLVDWLFVLHNHHGFSPEVLHLTVNIIHRFLAKVEVTRDKLQLVGVAAFFIASKYEEIWAPSLKELVYLCENIYSEDNIVLCETLILKTLNYDMSAATSHKFLLRFCKAAGDQDEIRNHVANMILDGTLMSYNLQRSYLPSELAAGAVLVANKAARHQPWSNVMEHHTLYSMPHVINVAKAILEAKASLPENLQGVENKYATGSFQYVSKTTPLNRVRSWLKKQSTSGSFA